MSGNEQKTYNPNITHNCTNIYVKKIMLHTFDWITSGRIDPYNFAQLNRKAAVVCRVHRRAFEVL